ncbi:MAG TPA: MBL fold metallo-hydrolase [Kiritimatiellia bacterium]|nr:MBL fold metallo-hydrolase [Kiritimatiellia bacterium]
MRLIPLGINGYLPINGRHTSCFLVLFEDAAFMLDAGTGAARLHEPSIQALLEPYRELHLLLSHYHVDHSVGLYYAFTAWRKGTLHIHAPVCPYIQADPVEAIRRYFSPPLNSYLLDKTTIQIHSLNQAKVRIGGHDVQVWPQKHPGGSVGLKFDDALAYVTDTVVMPENASQVRGVKVLLHELWLNDADAAEQESENQRHACFGPVAKFVKDTRPGLMMPVHLYPHYSDEALKQMAKSLQDAAGVDVELPEECREYTIDVT